ncbi:MAG: hypothetical protein PWQ41_361 [Bacillota bacterium]|nr:hypothetical protein [Bacillota bacterium]MDK2854812.1 hypothetical protein [Bacillota bacterium]MDK2924587.1 hypothetical protein [Bacillota bacterium]
MRQGAWAKFWETVRGVFQGSFDFGERAVAVLRKEAFEENDTFLLLCFADLIGIPVPTSYYSIELLPYLAEELEGWEKRILERRSVVAEKFGKHDWCC